MNKKIESINNIVNVDSMLWKLEKENNNIIENIPKINDICSINTEWYCKEINNFLSTNFSKFDFKKTYKKTLNTDTMPV